MDSGNAMLLAAKYHTAAKDSDTILLGTQGYAAPEQYEERFPHLLTTPDVIPRCFDTVPPGSSVYIWQ